MPFDIFEAWKVQREQTKRRDYQEIERLLLENNIDFDYDGKGRIIALVVGYDCLLEREYEEHVEITSVQDCLTYLGY